MISRQERSTRSCMFWMPGPQARAIWQFRNVPGSPRSRQQKGFNVSRTVLIKRLDQKAVPHRKVGKHRRIRMEDFTAERSAIEREGVPEQLSRHAQIRDTGNGAW